MYTSNIMQINLSLPSSLQTCFILCMKMIGKTWYVKLVSYFIHKYCSQVFLEWTKMWIKITFEKKNFFSHIRFKAYREGWKSYKQSFLNMLTIDVSDKNSLKDLKVVFKTTSWFRYIFYFPPRSFVLFMGIVLAIGMMSL